MVDSSRNFSRRCIKPVPLLPNLHPMSEADNQRSQIKARYITRDEFYKASIITPGIRWLEKLISLAPGHRRDDCCFPSRLRALHGADYRDKNYSAQMLTTDIAPQEDCFPFSVRLKKKRGGSSDYLSVWFGAKDKCTVGSGNIFVPGTGDIRSISHPADAILVPELCRSR